MQTHDTARCVGLLDRGTLEPGMKADLNLIDFEALQLEAPHITFDLPAGGRRMYQGAKGYVATIVNGEVIMRNGEYTGAVPAPEPHRRGSGSGAARGPLPGRGRHGRVRGCPGLCQCQR